MHQFGGTVLLSVSRLHLILATNTKSYLLLDSGKNGEIIKIGDFCMVFNEQLNMSEPNSPFVTQTAIPSQPSAVMNNGNPNNGSGGIPSQIIETPPPPVPVTASGPSINANTAKSQRYSGGEVSGAGAQINTAKPSTAKSQSQRTGRGAKNATSKNERR